MPYIKQELRDKVDNLIDELAEQVDQCTEGTCDGVLNFIITRVVASGIGLGRSAPWTYEELLRAVGTFECAKLEFYRRMAAPKEDLAADKNGDVPEYGRISFSQK